MPPEASSLRRRGRPRTWPVAPGPEPTARMQRQLRQAHAAARTAASLLAADHPSEEILPHLRAVRSHLAKVEDALVSRELAKHPELVRRFRAVLGGKEDADR